MSKSIDFEEKVFDLLNSVAGYADAYPLDVFPDVDLSRIRMILAANGIDFPERRRGHDPKNSGETSAFQ